jgi:hypothetical protein
LWLLPIAMMQPTSLAEMRTYATCLIAIASAATFSILAGAVAGRAAQPVAGSETAGA